MEKITGTFICELNPEYGDLGLRPLDMPHADANGGMAVAHDLLEHFPGDSGSIADELMALGASYLLRGQTDYYQRTGNVNPPEKHLASDFEELYMHFSTEGFPVGDPGNVEPVDDEDAEETFQSAVEIGMDNIVDIFDFNEDAEDGEESESSQLLATFTSDEYRARMLGWLRRGYQRAVERFEGVDVNDLAYTVFTEIEEKANKWLNHDAEEGMTLDVEIDLEEISVVMTVEGDEWSEVEEFTL